MPRKTGRLRAAALARSNLCQVHELKWESPSNNAQMAELVDALASGASDRKVVEVQVLFWAP